MTMMLSQLGGFRQCLFLGALALTIDSGMSATSHLRWSYSNHHHPPSSRLNTPDNSLSTQRLLSKRNDERGLQSIIIKYPPQDPTDEESPTPAPTRKEKQAQQVVCRKVDNDVMATRTEVKLTYLAETNVEDNEIPEKYLNSKLPSLVSEAAISVAADMLCSGGTQSKNDNSTASQDNSTDGGARRSLASLADCVVMLSAGPPGTLQGNCTPSLSESKSCNEYADSFYVLHTDQCSPSDVRSSSLQMIAAGIATPAFLEAVNANSQSSKVEVTKLALVQDEEPAAAGISSAAVVSPTGALTGGGIAMVTLIVLVTLALVAFMFVWRRHVNRRNRRMEDDLKSIRTSWSQPSNGDGSFLHPDFNDLARRHSKLNVHKCKSALCEVCRPNLGVVQMLQVPKPSNNYRICGIAQLDCLDDTWDNMSALGSPDSPPRTRSGERHSVPLEVEPFEEEPPTFEEEPATPEESASDKNQEEPGPNVIISVEHVDHTEDAGEVAYVRSAHAKRSELESANQLLL